MQILCLTKLLINNKKCFNWQFFLQKRLLLWNFKIFRTWQKNWLKTLTQFNFVVVVCVAVVICNCLNWFNNLDNSTALTAAELGIVFSLFDRRPPNVSVQAAVSNWKIIYFQTFSFQCLFLFENVSGEWKFFLYS